MSQLFSQMWKGFESLPASRKLTILAAAGITLLSIFLAVVFINQPDYKVLYTNLSTEDAGQITARLQEKKIPYKLSPTGDMISVPSEKVSELRLELSASGLPKGGGVGFEIFDTKNLGVTEFVQQLNYQRALQGELTRTINSLDEIQQSRVHLVIPKKSLLSEDQKKPTASVIVKFKSDVDVWAAVDKNIVQGCDMCHSIQHKCHSCHTRHAFKATESRRPEACQTCHNAPDHPDIEYYRDSKHGSIYFIEGHIWDWSKQLKDANYISPTCQSCHMYYKGQYSHNMVRKAIMGEGDVLFYDNVFKGVKPTDYIKNSKELMSRREAWIEVCVQCHSPRFSREYLDSMDNASDSVFQYVSDAYATIKSLYEEGILYRMPENRPRAPAPVAEKVS